MNFEISRKNKNEQPLAIEVHGIRTIKKKFCILFSMSNIRKCKAIKAKWEANFSSLEAPSPFDLLYSSLQTLLILCIAQTTQTNFYSFQCECQHTVDEIVAIKHV